MRKNRLQRISIKQLGIQCALVFCVCFFYAVHPSVVADSISCEGVFKDPTVHPINIKAEIDFNHDKITGMTYIGTKRTNKTEEDLSCEFVVPNPNITSIVSFSKGSTTIDVLDPIERAKVDIIKNDKQYDIYFSKMNNGYYCGYGIKFPQLVSIIIGQNATQCIVTW